MSTSKLIIGGCLLVLIGVIHLLNGNRVGAQGEEALTAEPWVEEIEKTFIRSENCKQCHDRHYEEWKGMREKTPDLKVFGRVDAALLHGNAFESPVFKTVLGVWLETKPTKEEQARCLACHAPAVTVFPQHAEKITQQVVAGTPPIEGIGCTSCHLIGEVAETHGPPPTFTITPGETIFGPFTDPEENLVHPSRHLDLYNGANYCASCHFDKVHDVSKKELAGDILKGTVCQDCHMEQSTGSATSRRGSLTRGIGRHWFRGVVIPGIMLKNRNLQAEWMPRIDIETSQTDNQVEGTVFVRVGSLPHLFPDGDPVLKQFFVTVKIKDQYGKVLAQDVKQYGLPFEKILRGPIPDPLVKGGTTRKSPFTISIPQGEKPVAIEALLTYALIPEPGQDLKDRYLATLKSDKEREAAVGLLKEYAQQRVLTFRTKSL